MNKYHDLKLSKYNDQFLRRAIQKRMSITNQSSIEKYKKSLDNNEEEAKSLEETLQISYSSFFRNTLSFATLEHIVFPALLQKNMGVKVRELRIWSSACAGGQECYSLAILLEELLERSVNKFTYRIFATDVSDVQIKQATQGSYTIDTIKPLSMERIQKWFSKKGEAYTALERLKKNIDFSIFDLFNKKLTCPPVSIFGDFDLIVCANLLFYFEPKYQQIIIDKVEKCLAPGSYLMTGETERELFLSQGYREILYRSAIFEH